VALPVEVKELPLVNVPLEVLDERTMLEPSGSPVVVELEVDCVSNPLTGLAELIWNRSDSVEVVSEVRT
jgi:hypothetical protein